ncbi:MAG: hypothetical protein K0R88_1616 [Solirubrobacterales bacterium]|nr:hypothetical protein [Solirubrobacterales bacterium]
MTKDARQEPGAGDDGQAQLLEQFALVELEPMLRHIAVHHAIELYRCKNHLPVRRREALELTAVGASEGHPGRDRVVTAPDLLDREPKVGKRPDKDIEDELHPGICVQGVGHTRGMGHIARSARVGPSCSSRSL